MVSGKDLHFLAAFEHDIDKSIDVLRFLRFLSYLSKYSIPADSMSHFDLVFIFYSLFALIPHKTHLVGMHKIISVSEIDFFIF